MSSLRFIPPNATPAQKRAIQKENESLGEYYRKIEEQSRNADSTGKLSLLPPPKGAVVQRPRDDTPSITPSAPNPRKMRDMKRTQRQADRASKRAARQQARQERNTTRRMQRDAMQSATTRAQRKRLRGQHKLQNRMGPGVGGFFEGGSVRGNKSNFGTTDYRKTGMTTHTSVRSRKK